MSTYIAYFDETGDDGITTASSDVFVLTSIYMEAEKWQTNYDQFKGFRKTIKESFGLHTSAEMHTMHFLRDKGDYRNFGWTRAQREDILKAFAIAISKLGMKTINVIIDKNNIRTENYSVLEKALTYMYRET